MAGDALPELAAAAVRGGATVVEVGIPFSDPLADGPTIQAAGQARTRRRHDAAALPRGAGRDACSDRARGPAGAR